MGWNEPNNAWDRALRKRANQWLFSIVATMLIVLMVPLIGWYMLSRTPAVSNLNIFDGFYGLFALCFIVVFINAAIFAWRWRVETRIRLLIPQHNGLVCPFCRKPLTPTPEAMTCPNCHGCYAAEAVQRFWEDYGLDRLAASARLGDIAVAAGKRPIGGLRHASRRALAKLKGRPVLGFVFPLLLFLLMGFVTAIYTGGSVLGAWLEFVPFLFMFGGFSLITLAVRRVGDEAFCAKCDYQLAPEGINPDRCPECGAAWKEPGGTVRGRRARRLGLAGIGVLLVLAFFGLMLVPVRWRAVGPKVLPTGSLIRDVTSPRVGFTDGQWAALSKRTLTPEQIVELAEGLLSYRRSSIALSQDGEKWFTTMIAANKLPGDLVEKYYRGMLDVSLTVPNGARVGQPFEVRLTSIRHTNIYTTATFGDDLVLYFSGFFEDDAAAPLGHVDQFIYGNLMESPQYAPAAEITHDRRGQCRIRAVLWLVAGPRSAITRNAVWQPDGLPVIPSGTSWSKRIELERTVEVSP